MLSFNGILIDFGYTLAYIDKEEDTNYRKELVTTFKKYGYKGRLDEFSHLLDAAYRNNRAGETKDMHEFWSFLIKSLGIFVSPSLIQELEKIRKRYISKTIRLYDGAVSVLSDLSKRYKLALVSNCATGLSEVIEASSLNHFFDSVILSYEVGKKKPDAQIYLEALRQLDLKAEECIFVADEITDLEGAREVGLKTFLVHQGPHTTNEAEDSNFKPDYQCKKISEILQHL